MILDDLAERVAWYDEIGVHYNLVAAAIYAVRPQTCEQLIEREFLRKVVAGLVVFDMKPRMHSGIYSFDAPGAFAHSLQSELIQCIQDPEIAQLLTANLAGFAFSEQQLRAIRSIYALLSRAQFLGKNGKRFDVGATKILHFLNPHLFPILDRNVASAMREMGYIPFTKTTQPGWSPGRYIEMMRVIQIEIESSGLPWADPRLPIRLFDKAAFIVGRNTAPANADEDATDIDQ